MILVKQEEIVYIQRIVLYANGIPIIQLELYHPQYYPNVLSNITSFCSSWQQIQYILLHLVDRPVEISN